MVSVYEQGGQAVNHFISASSTCHTLQYSSTCTRGSTLNRKTNQTWQKSGLVSVRPLEKRFRFRNRSGAGGGGWSWLECPLGPPGVTLLGVQASQHANSNAVHPTGDVRVKCARKKLPPTSTHPYPSRKKNVQPCCYIYSHRVHAG